MKKLHSMTLLLGLAAVAGPASAADTGWYAGVDLGSSNYAQMKPSADQVTQDLAQQGIATTNSVSDTATAYGLDVGYQFLRYFAVEGGYVDLGSVSADINATAVPVTEHVEIHAKGETLYAVGILPLSDNFSLFGKLGALVYTQDFKGSVSATGLPTTDLPHSSDSGTTPAIGVGADWNINDRFGLRLGFTRFHAVGDANDTGKGTIDLSYLQFLVHF